MARGAGTMGAEAVTLGPEIGRCGRRL
jgi:hypothetical protein